MCFGLSGIIEPVLVLLSSHCCTRFGWENKEPLAVANNTVSIRFSGSVAVRHLTVLPCASPGLRCIRCTVMAIKSYARRTLIFVQNLAGYCSKTEGRFTGASETRQPFLYIIQKPARGCNHERGPKGTDQSRYASAPLFYHIYLIRKGVRDYDRQEKTIYRHIYL